jgi:hypothetical protein
MGWGNGPTEDVALFKTSLHRIAADFDIEPELVEAAIENAVKVTHDAKYSLILRLQAVSEGLVRELGGRKAMQAWSRAEIPALNDARPLDVLLSGRLRVLERVEKVLKTGIFS